MAVSKIWKVTARLDRVINYAVNPEKTDAKSYTPEQYQSFADVLRYAKDEEKTEREFYVDGINCNPSTARDQFVTVKYEPKDVHEIANQVRSVPRDFINERGQD